ncbi:MAG: copper amine oxidase, partial [Clostridiaceae bacterium]|nr:copper amine oxidase [Clostridiaceae bacterium]
MKKSIVFMILSALIITLFNYTYVFSSETSQDIKVRLNGNYVQFDEKPAIIENRTIVPMRAIFESLGAKVEWNGQTRTVTGSKENIRVTLQIDSDKAYVNNKLVILDATARIINGRTFVPIRFISESLGAKVDWDDREKTVIINVDDNLSEVLRPTQRPTPATTPKPVYTPTRNPANVLTNMTIFTPEPGDIQGKKLNLDSLMGASIEKVLELFGQPVRKDLSKYGFYWYIYNHDYSKYIQIGIDESGKVRGIYTNSEYYSIDGNIKVGDPGAVISNSWKAPLQYIQKGNVRYKYDNNNEQELHLVNDSFFATVFFDIHNSGKLTAYLLIDKQTELSLKGYYGQPSTELEISYERQILDLANSIRVRNGKAPYVNDEKLAAVSRKHSED